MRREVESEWGISGKPEEYAVGSCLEILALWCLPSVVVPLIIAFTASIFAGP